MVVLLEKTLAQASRKDEELELSNQEDVINIATTESEGTISRRN